MGDFVKMRSPLESSRRIILAKAVAMAFEHCTEPDDPREIASLAAHFAIEMMRTLHKDDEIQREKEYHTKLGITYLTMQTPIGTVTRELQNAKLTRLDDGEAK